MNKKINLSIIIPIYKAEQTISKCLESILNQTYNDYELLLVIDGSPDNSLEICEKYLQNDSRIRIFQKKNGGVSSARNVGLKHAKGEWVFFIDADDWLEKNCLSEICKATINGNVDIVQFGTNRIRNNIVEISIPSEKPMYFRNHDEFDDLKCYRGELWNYIFRLQIINSYFFRFSENLKYAEDQEFIFKYFSRINAGMVIPYTAYNYYLNENSAVSVRFSPELLNHNLVAVQNALKYYIDNKIFVSKFVRNQSINLMKLYLSYLVKTEFNNYEWKVFTSNYKLFYENIYLPHLQTKNSRLIFGLAYRSMNLYKYLFIIKKIVERRVCLEK